MIIPSNKLLELHGMNSMIDESTSFGPEGASATCPLLVISFLLMEARGPLPLLLGLLSLVSAKKCPCSGEGPCRITGNLTPVPRSLRVLKEPYLTEGTLLSDWTISVQFKLRILGFNASDYGFVYNDTSLKIEWVPQRNEPFLPAVLKPKLFASKPNASETVLLTLKFPDLLYNERTHYSITIFSAIHATCRQTVAFKPPLTTNAFIECSKLEGSSCHESLRKDPPPKCLLSPNVSTALIKKHGNWDAEVEVTVPKNILAPHSTVYVYFGRCSTPVGAKSRNLCALEAATLGAIAFCGNATETCSNTFVFRLSSVGFTSYGIQVCVGGRETDLLTRRLVGKRLQLPISQPEGEEEGFPGWKSFIAYGVLLMVVFALLVYTLAHKHRQKNLAVKKGKGRDLWELDEADVDIDYSCEIGRGTFTAVYKGALTVTTKESRAIADGPVVLDEQSRVAVKIMHNDVTERERKLFAAEVERNKLLGRHARIVNFVGLLAMGTTPALVMEFCAKGCLRDFLVERRLYFVQLSREGVDAMNIDLDEVPSVRRDYLLNVQQLIRFAFQICIGLEYLASQKILHRDLNAKHVLVTADDSVKIGQFRHATSAANHSKSLERTDVNALRWMSPEVLRAQHFSNASDVWSMGVVFYEIFSVGGFPYANISNCDLLDLLDQGHRLERPPNSPDDLYQLMCACWKTEPSERPNCRQIRDRLAGAFDVVERDPEANRLRIDPSLACYGHSEVARPRRPSREDSIRSASRRRESLRARASRSAVTESERLLGFEE
uniref:Protein kinase domain-containing protein n=1 Tax=Steinernema glaseri TaxID=37863 RepID=A0A1I7YI02_9BILA